MIEAVLLVCYGPALHGGFLWDDGVYISANPVLQTMHGLWAIWADPSATCQYYPLSFTAFWIINHFFGLTPLAFHLATLMMHGVVVMVFWRLLERLRVRGALLGAAIFALHPLNVMSVAWMTELKNTLSCALALGAALAYVRFAGLGEETREGKGGWGWYVLALGLFGVAMLAKTAVSFLPVSLLLVMWWQRQGLSRRDLLSVAPMFGVALGMGALTIYIERHAGGASGAEFNIGFVDRVLISGRSFWFYLGKFVWPSPLIFIYPRWKVDAGVWWQWAYPVGTVAVLMGAWQARGRIGRGVFVGLMHFYVSTSMLVLAVVLYMMRYSFVADHWAYFGSLGLAALAGAGIARVRERLGEPWGKPLELGIGVCLVLGLGALTFAQSGMYSDIETLWRTTLDRNPDCWMADNNVGTALTQDGRWVQAMDYFRTALAINPDDAETHCNLGMGFQHQGKLDEAIAEYQRALALYPGDAKANDNLGLILFGRGELDEALAHYQRAVETDPAYMDARYNLGIALQKKGELDQAIAQFQKAIDIKPDYAPAWNNLGTALQSAGVPDQAVAAFQKAIEIKPDYELAWVNYGVALQQAQRPEDAIASYKKALGIKPDDADAWYDLGVVLQQTRDMAGAIAAYQRALQYNGQFAEAESNLACLLSACEDARLRDGAKAQELAMQANQLTGGNNPIVLDTLAAAYAEQGRFPEAKETVQRAIQLAEASGNSRLSNLLQGHLKLYQAGKPLRNP